MISFAWGSAIHVGQVRQVNQDNLWTEDGLFAVADGMGGHRGGEVASALALEGLREAFTERTSEALIAAIQHANDRVVAAGEDPELRGMGTTLAVLALVRDGDNEVLTIANVGDSRIYLLRSESEELEQISEDHSLVATLQRQGQLSKDEAAAHPQRNIITRALGIDTTVLVDSWDLVPVRGDRYLICSDGLVNEVEDSRIAATLRRLADPSEAAAELVRLANEHGGRDNISVVVVDIVEADFELEPAPGREGESRVVRSGVPDEPFHVTDPTQPVPVVPPSASPPAEGGATAPEAPGPASEGEPAGTAQATVRADRPEPSTHDDGPSPAGPSSAPAPAPAERRGRRSKRSATKATEPAVERDAGARSRVTWRVGLFVLVLVALVAGTVWVVAYAAQNTYFVVADEDGEVAIWKGRQGGILWIDPEVAEALDPPLNVEDVTNERDRRDLEDGHAVASLDEAREYIERVRASTTTTTTSTTSTTTSTTAPATTAVEASPTTTSVPVP